MAVRISLDSCPSLGDLYRVSVENEGVDVDHGVYESLEAARKRFLEEASRRKVYGMCTGLGDLYDVPASCNGGSETEVLREHAVGIGPRAPEAIVRAFLFARLAQLSRGAAPVRGVVARRLEEALNAGIHPVIPMLGSLGASGDLAPSSHAFLCIHLGVGDAVYEGRLVKCRRALEREGLDVVQLEPGEALALINNTAWSTGIAGLALAASIAVVEESLKTAVDSLGITGCNSEHFSIDAARAKKLPHIATVAERVMAGTCDGRRLQDPYSIRCIPVIYGSVQAFLEFSAAIVESELCASPENPAVIDGKIYHTCNFHSASVGMACDSAAIALAHVANMAERRIAQLLNGKTTGLADYLRWEGSPSGAMILQYTAASIAMELRRAAQPATVHNIPTSGLQEDVVPNSPAAAMKLLSAARRLAYLVSMERVLQSIAATLTRGQKPVFPYLSLLVEEEDSRLSRRLGLDKVVPSH